MPSSCVAMIGFSGLVYGMQKLQFSSNEVKLLDFLEICVQKTLKAVLITRGRKTGAEHAVWLRAVLYDGMVYFSRRNENSDWLKNALANPTVKVQIDEKVHVGVASLVTDESLAKKISELKYPSEKRAQEARIVLQVKLDLQ
jgi:hypothetical protein